MNAADARILEKINAIIPDNLACKMLLCREMSSYESIYKKMAAAIEAGDAGSLQEMAQPFDPVRHIAPTVAHELNNMLTIVQGYTDRLLLKHREDSTLQSHLNLISEASKRAAAIVRAATPPNANETFRKHKNSMSVAA